MSVSINAALRVPGHQGEGYFFKGQRYLRMWWKPGTPEERKVFGPAKITDEWKIIRDAGFTSVDAMLPSTNDPQKVYAFSGNRYVRFSFVPGTPQESKIFGPAKIVDEWKSLRDAGFEKVDAVIPIPSTKKEEYEEEAYFFSGTQYIRVRYTPGTPKEEVVFGPTKITNEWKILRDAGFDTMDAFIPNSNSNTDVEVYGFRGTKYVRFRFTPGTPKEEVIFGPAGISENWATLREL
ncbi:hypothetical protein D8B26_001275 [Coccidioides posadasii str. Silveira]|uniref:Uncharacterized protein n=2 Tax=Coccidioides posadasii TaxID=199306 RepID=E9DA27_COCPS|nr:conserved hypothetical protein [Coccidioides posadasii str. Silveira]KMM64481.1 hypothetical protein CPAG_00833 [Coccidioides posadasii RMSCC 3488]QVM06568.1 hypothetical protein D8B26_001275 [Coccidioides posadasii str. Silveira]